MSDTICKIGSSTIHHGKANDRIYLMSLDTSDCPSIISKLDDLADKNSYTKIFAKVPSSVKDMFFENGYKTEACVPKFYKDVKDGYFLAKYCDKKRSIAPNQDEISNILKIAKSKETISQNVLLNGDLSCRMLNKNDACAMAQLYKTVFESYPFPIFDKNYLIKTMSENITYFGVFDDKKLVGISSIELYEKYSNAEMTDFAVNSDYRGKGIALFLLSKMEEYLKEIAVKTAYTIARAISPSMNITFSKNGYTYAGTLINNTNISGQVESMNVWFKYID